MVSIHQYHPYCVDGDANCPVAWVVACSTAVMITNNTKWNIICMHLKGASKLVIKSSLGGGLQHSSHDHERYEMEYYLHACEGNLKVSYQVILG